MNHDNNHLSGWPLVISWLANAALYLAGGMNPLQVLALLVTIGYTVHRWWLLKRGKPTE